MLHLLFSIYLIKGTCFLEFVQLKKWMALQALRFWPRTRIVARDMVEPVLARWLLLWIVSPYDNLSKPLECSCGKVLKNLALKGLELPLYKPLTVLGALNIFSFSLRIQGCSGTCINEVTFWCALLNLGITTLLIHHDVIHLVYNQT